MIEEDKINPDLGRDFRFGFHRGLDLFVKGELVEQFKDTGTHLYFYNEKCRVLAIDHLPQGKKHNPEPELF